MELYEITIWKWQEILHRAEYEFKSIELATQFEAGIFEGLRIAGKEPTGMSCKVVEAETELTYGAKTQTELEPSPDDEIIKCNNCDRYHYDSIGGRFDTYHLQLLGEGNGQFKGCGNCQTDDYLMDLDDL